jgi:hypothetical protein
MVRKMQWATHPQSEQPSTPMLPTTPLTPTLDHLYPTHSPIHLPSFSIPKHSPQKCCQSLLPSLPNLWRRRYQTPQNHPLKKRNNNSNNFCIGKIKYISIPTIPPLARRKEKEIKLEGIRRLLS